MLIFISEGFPEFARFFNHSHLWKLQLLITAECSAIELLRKTRPTHELLQQCVERDTIFIADD